MNGDRLRQVRELVGWSQTELATRVGVSQSTIAYIESGRLSASEALTERIAAEFGLPPSFFNEPPRSVMPLGSLLYRSRTSATATDKTRAHRYAELVHELFEKLLVKVRPLPVRIPEVDDAPEVAARLTRSALGLPPDRPVANLINTLERAGVLILMLPEAYEGLDGFSVWAGPKADKPVIVLSPGMTPDRLRFTVAHELGHLVLHRAARGGVKEIEQEAMRFAREFLFPEDVARQEILPPVTLTSLAMLKPRWGMSIKSLIYQCHDLGIITARQRSYLYAQYNARRWGEGEPGNDLIPVEKPRAIRQLAEMMYGPSLQYWRIAHDLRLPVSVVESALEACAGPPGNGAAKPVGSGTGRVLLLHQPVSSGRSERM